MGRQTVVFDGSSSFDDWQVVSWNWTWDGGQVEGRIASGRFALGVTPVTLLVRDALGRTAQDSLIVTVNEQPRVKALDAGGEFGLFLMEDGSLYAKGRSGILNPSVSEGPLLVFPSGVVSMSAGYDFSLIVKEDGSLWALGSNSEGQLGLGSRLGYPKPFEVMSEGVVAAAAGFRHSLALKSDGSVWSFGLNEEGQLGDGTSIGALTPRMVIPEGVYNIAAGESFSLFLKTDGSLWGTGANRFYQLGYGSQENSLSPIEMVSDGVRLMDGGASQTVFVKDDGSIWAYHDARPGEAIEVPGLPSGVVEIESKGEVAYVRLEDGSLWGAYEGLGIPSIEWSSRFRRIFSSGILDMGIFGSNSLFLRVDGSVWESSVDLGAAVKIFDGFEMLPNLPPFADAGPDVVVYAQNSSFLTGAFISDEYSWDDWQIVSWNWKYGDLDRFTSGSSMYETFPDGETIVTLTVTDDEGLTSSDEVKVTVLDYSVFEVWLSEYFDQSEIDSWDRSPLESDPDMDGYTNEEERRLGLNPKEPFDPISKIETRVESGGGRLLLKTKPGIDGLRYSLWFSEDMINWSQAHISSLVEEGAIIFDISERPSGLYRVGISE